ncbi:MAG: hypothetical protein LM560_06040 [Desulfurococcaceae archaeon]|jgi:hypothetical protein|nr:hypothetical protein [Desulfurococcaceae archaeon]
MKNLIMLSLITLLISASVVIGVKYLLEVNTVGIINVPNMTKVVDIKVDINEYEGEKTFYLGSIKIPSGNIQVRSKLINYEGNFTILLNGELTLKSNNITYRILMPCLLSIGESCYRIMMLIPGYDLPLKIDEGVYEATLELRWLASGYGVFNLKLYLEWSS